MPWQACYPGPTVTCCTCSMRAWLITQASLRQGLALIGKRSCSAFVWCRWCLVTMCITLVLTLTFCEFGIIFSIDMVLVFHWNAVSTRSSDMTPRRYATMAIRWGLDGWGMSYSRGLLPLVMSTMIWCSTLQISLNSVGGLCGSEVLKWLNTALCLQTHLQQPGLHTTHHVLHLCLWSTVYGCQEYSTEKAQILSESHFCLCALVLACDPRFVMHMKWLIIVCFLRGCRQHMWFLWALQTFAFPRILFFYIHNGTFLHFSHNKKPNSPCCGHI